MKAGEEGTSRLVELARAYVAASEAEQRAKLARMTARDRLLQHAPEGFNCYGVRVSKRTSWKLTPAGATRLAAARADIIEDGEAEQITALVATRTRKGFTA
jgi:hypothetical protein